VRIVCGQAARLLWVGNSMRRWRQGLYPIFKWIYNSRNSQDGLRIAKRTLVGIVYLRATDSKSGSPSSSPSHYAPKIWVFWVWNWRVQFFLYFSFYYRNLIVYTCFLGVTSVSQQLRLYVMCILWALTWIDRRKAVVLLWNLWNELLFTHTWYDHLFMKFLMTYEAEHHSTQHTRKALKSFQYNGQYHEPWSTVFVGVGTTRWHLVTWFTDLGLLLTMLTQHTPSLTLPACT
jgi:hypothetical protein